MIGKLFPYFFLGLLDLSLAVLMGKWVFQVPLRGSVALLFALSCIYILVALALGLTISTVARTQLLANQMAMVIGFLPTFLLSGFTFVIRQHAHLAPDHYLWDCAPILCDDPEGDLFERGGLLLSLA